jgi:undecaprenyl-diphosphatase
MKPKSFVPGAVTKAVRNLIPFIIAVLALSPECARCAATSPDPSSFDVRIFRFLNGTIANPSFDAVMPWITDFNNWRIAVILIWSALVIFGKSRARWLALVLLVVIAASDQLASSVIKPLIERMRPCEVLGSVHLWYGPEGWITTPTEVTRSYKASFSFPSSHAANITASMLLLGLVYRRWLWPLLAVAFAVSFSRIYIGVHWPSDVAVGMALGALVAWLAYALMKRLHRGEQGVTEETTITQSEPDTPPSE